MLTFAPKGIRLDFVWLAELFLWLFRNHCRLAERQSSQFSMEAQEHVTILFFKMSYNYFYQEKIVIEKY